MNRAQQLDKWLQKVLCAADFRRQPLAGDASFRSYWRVTVGGLSYVVMDAPQVEKWVAYFQSAATKAGLLNREQSQSGFLKWFDFTGLQRHLKNLGIFARLHHRDNKSGYLKDIPQVQRYICETCERYPELQPLRFFLDTLQEKSCAR